MLKILGYQPEDLMNKSLYEYHHAGDSESLMGSFKSGKYKFYVNAVFEKHKNNATIKKIQFK